VRLNTARHPTFTDKHGQKRQLSLAPGGRVFLWGLRYKGEVNVAGVWEEGASRTPLDHHRTRSPKTLPIYCKGTAIEEGFRDLRGLSGLERPMDKTHIP